VKYICLGYIEDKKWETLPESERNAMMDECLAYDDRLRESGHFAGGEALDSPRNATTLRWVNGKVSVTDGPYAETKEQLGSYFLIEARDLNEAIQVASKHPAARLNEHLGWGVEVRPIEMCRVEVAAGTVGG